MSSCKCNVWFSPTEKERQPLENILFAINELSDSSTTKDSYTDVKVATQRAQVAPVEQDADLFRNIRLSRNELQSEFLESPGDPTPVFPIENLAGPQFDATMHSDDKTTRTLTGHISEFTRPPTYVYKSKMYCGLQWEVYDAVLGAVHACRPNLSIKDAEAEITNIVRSSPKLLEEFTKLDSMAPKNALTLMETSIRQQEVYMRYQSLNARQSHCALV